MANTIGMKRLVLGAMVVVCGFLVDGAAYAISVGASSGKGETASVVGGNSTDCFLLSALQVEYNPFCNTNGSWTVFLPVNAGNHTVSVSGAGGTSGTFCAAYGRSEGAPLNDLPNGVSFNWSAGTTGIKTVTVNVPTNGTLFFSCTMYNGSLLNVVNYNQ